MTTPERKIFRCAIYTRKSTEHNLDLEFNSLDAQREACEAYIKSQAHEGWRLVPDRYDDGGLSGASLDRPALQKLLADVGAGRITIVVVYKVDRLTRSLADFAKLVELFDQHGVSFVSITQSFNTTSSMGRLTLNVLLSFAQFEREVIGERVRDKIAASKRKGLWVGGPVPLGYRCIDKKLEIVPVEAETVRTIFARYLELGSMGALLAELDRQGIRTKVNVRRDGGRSGGICFGVGSLAHLLKNRFYLGEITYRGEVHRGEHEPILGRDLFEAVQAKRAANAVARQVRLRGAAAILTGRLFDDRGNRMSPTHSNKRGVRYRYYVSHAILQNRKAEAGSIARVPAPPKLRKHFHEKMFNGFDFDPTMLRIGSMNMILHGVENAHIVYRDSLAEEHNADAGRYSLVLANPPFAGSLDYEATAKDLQQIVKTKKTELLFLALFLRLLKVGGRAAVIVPDGVLFGSSKAHKDLRRMLVDDHKLDAVIKLPSGVFRPYAGVSTAILVFTKTGVGGTDHVWFYDMEADGWSLDDKRQPLLPEEKLGPSPQVDLSEDDHSKNNLPDALIRWKNRDGSERNQPRSARSFCVPRTEIAATGYDLSLNRYKETEHEEQNHAEPAIIVREIRALEVEIAEGLQRLEAML